MTHQTRSVLFATLVIITVTLAACTVIAPGGTFTSTPVCVVDTTNLNLRTGPGIDYPRTTKMPAGSQFRVRARNGEQTWYVGDWNGQTGWASAAFLDCPAEVVRTPRLTMWPEPPLVAPPLPQTGREEPVARAASAAPAPVAAANAGSVALLDPLAPALGGRLVFRWAPSTALQSGQGYELVFWRNGGDPMRDGFSPIGARPESEVRVDLDQTARNLTLLNYGEDYQWGVLLVQLEPYQRLAYLGGAHPFRFVSGDSGGSSGDDPQPESTNEPIDPGQPEPTRIPSSPFEPTPEPTRPSKPPGPPGAP